MDIDGCSALVTGGASGLGAATARALAKAGAAVVVVDLQEEQGKELAAEIGGVFSLADVTDATQVTAAVELAASTAPLRALVNCAGTGAPRRTIGRDGGYDSAHPLDWFQYVINVNLVGTFNMTRIAASAMSRTEPHADGLRGCIVNTASLAAFEGQVGQASYAASKAGIVGMTLPIARDLAPAGIRVNTVAPGFIDTPAYGTGEQAATMKEQLAPALLCPARFGLAEEFAALVCAILANDYMNAETIRLDGGARMLAR